MSELTLKEYLFPPVLEKREIKLSNGRVVQIPFRARKVRVSVVNEQVTGLEFYNSSVVPNSRSDKLNLEVSDIEKLVAQLNAHPEQKIYNLQKIRDYYNKVPAQR